MSAPSHRLWKILGRIVLTTVEVVLIAAFLAAAGYACFSHYDWYQTRRALLAKGEKLSLVELAPPPIPDHQNFFADPIWEELATDSPIPKGQRQLDILRSIPTAGEMKTLAEKYPSLRWPDYAKDRLAIAITVWHYHAPKDQINQDAAARFTLALLAPADPLLQKITQLLDRPASRMLSDYSDVSFFDNESQPSLLFNVAQALSVQARAQLILGEHDAAFVNILTLGKLAKINAGEPLLWPFSMRESVAQMLAGSIRQGLATHAWTDTDLQAFEKALAPLDILAQLPLALRGERDVFNQSGASVEHHLSSVEPAPSGWEAFSYLVLAKAYDLIIIPSDRALYDRIMQPAIDATDHAPQLGLGQSKVSDALDVSTLRFGHYRYVFTQVFLPDFTAQASRAAFVQDQLIQGRLACALESYRLKTGAYPADLSALVPDFLPAIPVDVITLQPMFYQAKPPDAFRLWSVGWNETNEGGTPTKTGQKQADWLWDPPSN